VTYTLKDLSSAIAKRSEEQQVGTDPIVGRRFGSYVVEALIGAGGMGAVYRAVQPEIGKQVAIKFLSAALSAQPDLVQRFFAEARSVNLIQHDNIVDIFDFGSADGMSWFVMELLRGRSLTAVLAYESRLLLPRAVDVAAQIADAIAAAHARGIIHRDLKGDNIFLVQLGGREDFVKILDFGIAKLSDPGSFGNAGPYSHTRTGAILGTPGYMSPEQGTGGTVDGRTDVYALGVIAYRMLTGRLPFEGLNHLEIVQKQLTSDPIPLHQLRPDVPPALADLIHQMLARQPEARPQKMAEVRDRLRALSPADFARGPSQNYSVEAATIQGPPTTLSGASGQMSRVQGTQQSLAGKRSRAGLVLGLGGGLVLVGAGIGAVLFLRQPKLDAPPAVVAQPAAKVEAPAPKAPEKSPDKPKPIAGKGFDCLVESDPPGASVVRAGKTLGKTPITLKLNEDPTTITLKLSGFGDEDLEVARDTEHAIIRLHKLALQGAKATVTKPPKTNAPATKKKTSIGLDD
jgi:serine/threonine-protein kinase